MDIVENGIINEYRNIGIIAHIDHGKTTLVDKLLESSGVYRENAVIQDRAMDSMDLEKEKGITIRSKNASVKWEDTIINIVDTPGHADFGGEVERILKMVDGVLLIVDAAEGPQAQTRFVLKKAIENDLKLICIINKIDREFSDAERVHDEVLELLLELNATEEQFNAPFVYCSAKKGFAITNLDDEPLNMDPLFRTVITHIPAPVIYDDEPFKMLVSNVDWDDYVGRIAIGKIRSGSVKFGDLIYCIDKDGELKKGTVKKLFSYRGLTPAESVEVYAGDIVGIAGFEHIYIGETLCDNESRSALPFVEIDPLTIQMQICVNDGPFAGRDGKYVTARNIRDRLEKETRTNISLEFQESQDGASFIISARGELQIAVLVETMRREGFELLISRPEVILHFENDKKLEPFEEIWLELPNETLGDIMQELATRKAQITNMVHEGKIVKLEATMPTRGLIGFENFIINKTSGQALLGHLFKEYAPFCGEIKFRNTGVLISMEHGTATSYALESIQERGKLFISPQEEVYEGMIIGENSRPQDLPVNPTKAKQLTNFRCQGEGKGIQLEPAKKYSLEKAIELIADDEYVEITPVAIRLRKRILNANDRKRSQQTRNLILA